MSTELEVMKAVAEYLGLSVEDLERSAFLRDDLNLGPIELNDLLSQLSQKFNISFEPEDIEGLQKVEDLIVLVEDNLID